MGMVHKTDLITFSYFIVVNIIESQSGKRKLKWKCLTATRQLFNASKLCFWSMDEVQEVKKRKLDTQKNETRQMARSIDREKKKENSFRLTGGAGGR